MRVKDLVLKVRKRCDVTHGKDMAPKRVSRRHVGDHFRHPAGLSLIGFLGGKTG
jgi:hypothetical protein